MAAFVAIFVTFAIRINDWFDIDIGSGVRACKMAGLVVTGNGCVSKNVTKRVK